MDICSILNSQSELQVYIRDNNKWKVKSEPRNESKLQVTI